MARKKKRRFTYDTASDKFISTLARRTNKVGDSETLRMLQNRISRKTMSLYLSDRNEQARIIRTFEDTLESLDVESPQYTVLQQALEKYRVKHIDEYTLLKDMSGKVRTTREAKEILRRLNLHTPDANIKRMRKNYENALTETNHEALAKRLSKLTDEQFLTTYYANLNADVGFLYHVIDDMSSLEDSWDRTLEIFGYQGMRTDFADEDSSAEWSEGEFDYLFTEE